MRAPRAIEKLTSVQRLDSVIVNWRSAIKAVIEEAFEFDDVPKALAACAQIADLVVAKCIPNSGRRLISSWSELVTDIDHGNVYFYASRLRRMARIADQWQPELRESQN